jgi:hypothetical protein
VYRLYVYNIDPLNSQKNACLRSEEQADNRKPFVGSNTESLSKKTTDEYGEYTFSMSTLPSGKMSLGTRTWLSCMLWFNYLPILPFPLACRLPSFYIKLLADPGGGDK